MCSLHLGEERSLQRAVRTQIWGRLARKVLSLEEAYWKRVAIFKRYLKGRVEYAFSERCVVGTKAY